MEIPKPGIYESENEFLTRAMSDQEFRAVFPEESDAMAVCRGLLWKRDHAADQDQAGDQDQGVIEGEELTGEEIAASGGSPRVEIRGVVSWLFEEESHAIR